MNETVMMIFGLVGGLALFLFGMNSMSDALQKAAGERMKKILAILTKNPIIGGAGRRFSHGSAAKQLGHNGNGHWLCQRGADELTPGYLGHFWRQHRHHHDGTADGL